MVAVWYRRRTMGDRDLNVVVGLGIVLLAAIVACGLVASTRTETCEAAWTTRATAQATMTAVAADFEARPPLPYAPEDARKRNLTLAQAAAARAEQDIVQRCER